jgi:hypothetical protein
MTPCRLLLACLALLAAQTAAPPAHALCGFYVGQSGTPLFSAASKVVLAHHDGRTVLTMVSNYQGALEEFALVVPVPAVLEPGQIRVAEHGLVDHLEAYTAPRLVERSDRNPCSAQASTDTAKALPAATAVHGVRVEAQQTVGEYDITILSAEQSAGLAGWLRQNGYRLPEGAEETLVPYIADGMRFLLARVNLKEQSKVGYSYLRPLQIAYESESLVLPIRLGMLNADGPQDLLVLALTRDGRLETSNYRTIEIPSDVELPLYVAKDPAAFYGDMFKTLLAGEKQPAVFLEYASQINACDPCAAKPMSFEELRELGAFWILDGGPVPAAALADEVFVTRLHLRYDAVAFPHDLRLRETKDRSRFQGLYVLRHPWIAEAGCEAAGTYIERLPGRFEEEAQALARLTGRPIADIRRRMESTGQPFDPAALAARQQRWWERLWLP